MSKFTPSMANPTSHQHIEISKQINVKPTSGAGTSEESTTELLQLRLENSELRMRLEDAISHTDESKSELLKLLEEQTTQTNLLQSKCDQLAAGFVEIDKERRALRQDSMHQVERTRAEYEKRCEALEKHIKIREKEVEKLAERTREQERRIEAAVSEWHDRQSKVDELEGELEKLIVLVDKERSGKKTAREQHIKEMEEMRVNKEDLERQLQDLQHSLHEKEAALANLQQDQEFTKMEHDQALKTMSDLLEAQKVEFSTQQKNMIDLHRNEASELTNTLQSQIDDKTEIIQSITSEMKQLHIVHNQKVAEMESSIREWEENIRAIEIKYQQSCESNEQLQGDFNSILSSYQIAQEEVKATKYLLEKENGELVKKLDGTKAQLAIVKEELSNLQMEHTGLQCDYASLEDKFSQLSKTNLAIKHELSEEKHLNNNLSSQLRELSTKVSEDVSVLQREKRVLEQELDSLRKLLSVKEKDALDFHSKYEATISSHLTEMEYLKSIHAEEVSVIEMRGADIVSDLEETISALKKEMEDKKLESEQVVNKMTLDRERVERSLHDKDRKIDEQDTKISSLTTYAKERKEEVRLVKTELAQVRQSLESDKQEHSDTVAAIRNELETSREVHQREMNDLKNIIEEVRVELERAKATLSERTNLLRDMVNQTTAYQGDYERERARANALEEAVSSYKRQLAEVRDVGQQLEREIHDKDSHYCDAIRNERQQRKTMESELESSRKAFEDLTRKLDEMEKENFDMKDKIKRQENYIRRLQEREKRERQPTASGSLRTSRPSTVGSKEHAAKNHRGIISSSCHIIDENKPNLK